MPPSHQSHDAHNIASNITSPVQPSDNFHMLLDLMRQSGETQQAFIEESRSIRDALQALTGRLERMDGSLAQTVERLARVDDLIPRVNRMEVRIELLEKDADREKDRHDDEDVRAPQDAKWVLSLVLSLLLSSASFLLYFITALIKK